MGGSWLVSRPFLWRDMKPETKLVKDILNFLKRYEKSWWVKIHGSAYQASGIPDIIGVYKGRFIAFEVKLPDKEHTVSRRQALMVVRITLAGGVAKVVSSMREVTDIMESL